jgi:hypothetical protein
VLVKEGGKHSRWLNVADRRKQSSMPRHTEIDDYLCRLICRQLGIPPCK